MRADCRAWEVQVGMTNEAVTQMYLSLQQHNQTMYDCKHHFYSNTPHYHQGSYRSPMVKFPDFSSNGMTISQTLSKQ